MLTPVLLFAPFMGVWVDRWNLKRVLVKSDLVRALLVVLIPLQYAFTHHTLPVFVIVFLLFTCNVLFLPAKSAITPEIVPHEQLLAANAWLSGAGIAATAVGALGGGWIIDHWGWPVALYLNGVTYLVSVIALLVIDYRPARDRAPLEERTVTGYLGEVAEGWRIVRHNPIVGLALTALGAVWIAGGFLHVAGNLHIQRAASAPGMERLGILMCVLGLGAGVGTWLLNAYGRRLPHAGVLGSGLLVATVGLVGFAVSTRFAVFMSAAFLSASPRRRRSCSPRRCSGRHRATPTRSRVQRATS
jgi:MFS family permease